MICRFFAIRFVWFLCLYFFGALVIVSAICGFACAHMCLVLKWKFIDSMGHENTSVIRPSRNDDRQTQTINNWSQSGFDDYDDCYKYKSCVWAHSRKWHWLYCKVYTQAIPIPVWLYWSQAKQQASVKSVWIAGWMNNQAIKLCFVRLLGWGRINCILRDIRFA